MTAAYQAPHRHTIDPTPPPYSLVHPSPAGGHKEYVPYRDNHTHRRSMTTGQREIQPRSSHRASQSTSPTPQYNNQQPQHNRSESLAQYPPSQSYPQQYPQPYPQYGQQQAYDPSPRYPQQYSQQHPGYPSQQYPQAQQYSQQQMQQYQRPYPEQYSQQYPQRYTEQYQQQYPQRYQNGYQNAPYQQYPPNNGYAQDDRNVFSQDPSVRSEKYGKRPCVIPQVTKVFGGSFLSPFVRARVPELEETWQITETEFLKFLDNLNESFIASPAFQAADGLGDILGFTPSATLQIVGVGMNVAAGLGTVAASKVRTKKYMKKANAEIFEPKGLHARLCKTVEMLAMAGLPNDKNLFMQTPPTPLRPGTQSVPQPPPGEDPKMVIKKRMAVLGDNVMPVMLDNVAPPAEERNWMKKMGQKAAANAEKEQLNKMHGLSDRKEVDGKAEVVQKIQRKVDDLNYRMQSMSTGTRDYRRKQEALRNDMGNLQRDLRDAERELQKELDRAMAEDEKLQGKMKKDGGRKQAKEANKILWLVIADKKAFADGDEDWDEGDADGSGEKSMSGKQAGSGRSVGMEEKKSRRWWSKK